MNKILSLQHKIVPELIELLERRYTILQNLYILQPVGRRGLAHRLELPERLIRNELDFFKEQGLIAVDSLGVILTPEGKGLLEDLKSLIDEVSGLGELEILLQNKLNIRKVMVVPGDSDQNQLVMKEIGRVASKYLLEQLSDASVIAITGGTTALAIADAMTAKSLGNHITVVPARGGLGEDVELQANSIAAKLAKKLGANYKLLYVPENIEEELVRTILLDPKIKQILDLIMCSNILIHGIGEAELMARRREMDEQELNSILAKGAVGEAFGHYFDKKGTIIHSTSSIGIGFGDLKNINRIIAVAGGHKKARAIISVVSKGTQDVLITDEGAAKKMVELLMK